jgi:hypothetical protein
MLRGSATMDDFAFTVNILAVVRVRADDEIVAREIVPTVLGSPSTAEIGLTNENNAVFSNGAVVTNVDFLVDEGSITLVEMKESAIR